MENSFDLNSANSAHSVTTVSIKATDCILETANRLQTTLCVTEATQPSIVEATDNTGYSLHTSTATETRL